MTSIEGEVGQSQWVVLMVVCRRRDEFAAKIPRRMQLFQMKDAAVVVEQTKAKEERARNNPLKDALIAKVRCCHTTCR